MAGEHRKLCAILEGKPVRSLPWWVPCTRKKRGTTKSFHQADDPSHFLAALSEVTA
jgi:hypothetical protein